MKKIAPLLLLLLSVVSAQASEKQLFLHSHNDYYRDAPFYDAYNLGFNSIEADVFLVDGELYVAHDKNEIKQENTLMKLYIEPIIEEMNKNGKLLPKEKAPLQLMIDLKTGGETLRELERQLLPYRIYFDRTQSPYTVQIVISGSTPTPDNFDKYTDFIHYDGRPYHTYTPEQLQRVAMISDGIDNYMKTSPNSISHETFEACRLAVETANKLGKPFRFWGYPDTLENQKIMLALGVSYLNTDHLKQLRSFIELEKSNKNIPSH